MHECSKTNHKTIPNLGMVYTTTHFMMLGMLKYDGQLGASACPPAGQQKNGAEERDKKRSKSQLLEAQRWDVHQRRAVLYLRDILSNTYILTYLKQIALPQKKELEIRVLCLGPGCFTRAGFRNPLHQSISLTKVPRKHSTEFPAKHVPESSATVIRNKTCSEKQTCTRQHFESAKDCDRFA